MEEIREITYKKFPTNCFPRGSNRSFETEILSNFVELKVKTL
jgi:hypothetical protein